MHDAYMNKDVCGYLASMLVFMTFLMQSMPKLRITAVCSNMMFIYYGIMTGLHPILVLHCVLLPLNVYRLAQIVLKRVVSTQMKVETVAGFPRLFVIGEWSGSYVGRITGRNPNGVSACHAGQL